MGERETVSEWGVHLSRHLQILMASFPECLLPDHIAELKHDHFYSGLPKQFKVMVAYMRACSNEKTCSNYLQAAHEAEEEVMEPAHNPPMASTSKSQVTSFFPLQKLKGSQPAITPSAWVAHLEEVSADKEECVNSEDPDGIKGITEEFIVCLVRAVKDAQQMQKHCYHCSSPDHFIHDCPLVAASRTDSHLNQKEGMVPKKGAKAPQGKVAMPKVPQDGTSKA